MPPQGARWRVAEELCAVNDSDLRESGVWWNADSLAPTIYWLFPDGVLVPLDDMDDEDWLEAIA